MGSKKLGKGRKEVRETRREEPWGCREAAGKRKRPAAQDRTVTTGPKSHQLNTIWHRVNTKSASKQHQSKKADVILDTLTSFSIRWCHSRYTDVILDTLTSLLMRWRHSRYADMIRDTLAPFPFTKCPATFLIEQTTGPNFAYCALLWLYLDLPDRFLIFGLVPNFGPIPEFLKFFSYLGPALENWSFYKSPLATKYCQWRLNISS